MSRKTDGIITLSLAGAMLLVGLVSTGYHYAQREAVVVEEHIAYGNQSEVSDLTITQFDSLNDQLVWTTAIPLADVSQAESELKQSIGFRYPPSKSVGYLDVWYNFNVSSSTSGVYDFSPENEQMKWFPDAYPIALYRDVASRVPVGEEYTETVRVADYGDYYLPEVHLDFPSGKNGDYHIYYEDSHENILIDYLRLPVGEDDMVTITMTHNGHDGINQMSTNLESDLDDRGKAIPTAFVDRSVYFVTQEEDGIAIHRLDWTVDEDYVRQASIEGVQQVKLLPNEQSFIYNESLVYRQQNNQLMIVCGEDDVAEKLVVLSLPDLEVVQEISLDIAGYERMYQGDDFIVLMDYDQNFVLFEDEDGRYQKAFGGNYTAHLEEELQWLDGSSLAMDYKNGKLTAAFRNHRNYNDVECFLYVTVNTIHGCTFAGQYTTSLQKEIPHTRTSDWVEQWGDLPVEMMRGQ